MAVFWRKIGGNKADLWRMIVLSELGADLLFTQIKLEGRKSSFVNLSRAASNLRQLFENRLEEGSLSSLVFEIR